MLLYIDNKNSDENIKLLHIYCVESWAKDSEIRNLKMTIEATCSFIHFG